MFSKGLRSVSARLAVDRAVIFSLATRSWQALAGVITVFIVAKNLSPVVQGFYYTLASLAALQVFFELGLGFVITQFASHEFAHQHGDREATHQVAKDRLTLLFRGALRWYIPAALLMIVGVIPAGLFFFSHSPESASTEWELPWILLVASTGFNLVLSPFFSFVEGSGRVAEAYRARLAQGALSALSAWIALSLGAELYALPIIALVNFVTGLAWLLIWEKPFFNTINQRSKQIQSSENLLSWWREIWPMQWRVAVSWMCGFLLTQLFTPLLFHYHGAEVAGRMGMTLTVISLIGASAQTWITVKLPLFGQLIARLEWQSLDRLFGRVVAVSTMALSVAGFSFLLIVAFSPFQVSARLIPPVQIFFLVLAAILNHLIVAMALYLRAHRREPFFLLSIIGAVLTATASLLLVPIYSSSGVVGSIFVINAVYGLPSAYLVWRRLKRSWHSMASA